MFISTNKPNHIEIKSVAETSDDTGNATRPCICFHDYLFLAYNTNFLSPVAVCTCLRQLRLSKNENKHCGHALVTVIPYMSYPLMLLVK